MDEWTIRVFKDGNMYCALIGDDLQSGVGGFGVTQVDSIRDLCDRISAGE